MSRPIFITYAPAGTSYPAGSNPWNGQPIRVVPGTNYSTPDTLLPAENFNYVLGSVTDETAWLGNIQVKNMLVYEGSYEGTPHNAAKPIWDDAHKLWLGGDATTTNGFQKSADYGQSWAAVAGAVDTTPDVHAIYVDISGVWYTVGQGAVGNVRFSKSSDQGATWTNGNVDAAWNPSKRVHDLLVVAGKYVIIGDDGTNARLYTSTNFSAWTHVTNPSAINTVTNDWRAAYDPVNMRWMAVAGQVYVTTIDGVSFTAGTSGFSASFVAKGICAMNGVFYAIGDDTTNTKIYSTTDGTSWTLVQTINGLTVNDINTDGLSTLVLVQSATGQNPQTMWSLDNGVTWTQTPIQLASDTGPIQLPRVLSSGQQLGIGNGKSLNLSVAL